MAVGKVGCFRGGQEVGAEGQEAGELKDYDCGGAKEVNRPAGGAPTEVLFGVEEAEVEDCV